jgi:hypothetical protein
MATFAASRDETIVNDALAEGRDEAPRGRRDR